MVQLQERKDLLVQQRDAWRDINTRLNHLRERIGALSTDNLFVKRAAKSANEDVLTASANRNAAAGTYDITVEKLAEVHRITSARVADGAELGHEGELTFLIGEDTGEEDADNVVKIEVEADDTMADVARKINEQAGPISAVAIDGRLVVRSKETGDANKISVEADNTDLLGAFGFQGLDIDESLDARLTVEGVEVTHSSNTIDDLIEGVTFTLRAEGNTVVSVDRDFDGVVDAVRSVVEQYNSVQTFIDNAMASNPEQGRKGLLAGDGLAMRIQSQLRTEVMGKAGGDSEFNQLMSVGISVDRYGKMSLDETKLREALAEDAEAVQRLFGATKDDDDPNSFDGIAVRMETTFQGWLQTNTGLLAERQKMFGNRMRSIDQSMERLENRLEMRERTLMRQFAALEDVMARFQSQGMWLEGQIQQMNALSGSQRR